MVGGIDGAGVRLVDDAGGAQVLLLAHLLAVPGFELLEAGPPPARLDPVGLLDTLPATVLERARQWKRHVVEVQTGLPPGAPAVPGRRSGTTRPGHTPRGRTGDPLPMVFLMHAARCLDHPEPEQLVRRHHPLSRWADAALLPNWHWRNASEPDRTIHAALHAGEIPRLRTKRIRSAETACRPFVSTDLIRRSSQGRGRIRSVENSHPRRLPAVVPCLPAAEPPPASAWATALLLSGKFLLADLPASIIQSDDRMNHRLYPMMYPETVLAGQGGCGVKHSSPVRLQPKRDVRKSDQAWLRRDLVEWSA